MNNFEYLMQDLLPWARAHVEPVKTLTFRCFELIERNPGLLVKYNQLIASKGSTPTDVQTTNRQIAQAIAEDLGLEGVGNPVHVGNLGEHLIESYHELQYKTSK
ncbi:MAG: hypothetical protein MJZ79_03940 [Paludibacteraceae bacterium]|nr:hypothetical protein [Paludibacteraceae bacterium]